MWPERSARRRKVGLTPLIDVVFQLLIFFMLASSFSQWRAISLAAEEAEAAAQGDERGIVARVRSGGIVEIAGRAVAAAALRRHLGEALAGRSDVGVLVVAEVDVSLQELVAVFDAAHAAGAAEVSLGRW